MGRVDPDRASTNQAKWMWTINTPCLLLSRHPGGIPRHYLFVSPSPVLYLLLSPFVVSCAAGCSSDNLQLHTPRNSQERYPTRSRLCFSSFFGLCCVSMD
ncbi:hypothetical protein GGI35DRAFT_452443 [Trichoderma velutinum]